MKHHQFGFFKLSVFTLFVGLPLSFGTAVAHAQGYPTRNEKEAWEGMLVFEEINGEHFFESLSLTTRLEALVAPEDYPWITKSMVATPMRIEDGWLFYWGCIPHSCGDAIHLALELDSNKIAVSIRHYYLPEQRQKLNVYTQFVNMRALPEKVANFIFMLEDN